MLPCAAHAACDAHGIKPQLAGSLVQLIPKFAESLQHEPLQVKSVLGALQSFCQNKNQLKPCSQQQQKQWCKVLQPLLSCTQYAG